MSLGTTLNALNSSMIAVALLSLQEDFGLDVADVTWVITLFYVASIVGQPLMGRIIDAFGPRRIFVGGMVLVMIAAAIAPLGGFGLVLAARVMMAIGTSVAFPAAVALVTPLAMASGVSPPRLLARIQVANTTAAAIGPVVGGILIALAGWPATFLINIPLALAALISVAALAPNFDAPTPVTRLSVVTALDPAGVIAFTVAAVALLFAALGAAEDVAWLLITVGVAALALFVWRELRAREPFIDVRMLAANPGLTLTYVAFTAFSVLYYLAFFGLPQFLEGYGGHSSAVVGVLMLPLSATAVLLAPVTARAIERRGVVPVLLAAAFGLLVAAGALGIGLVTTAPVWMLVMATLLGVPYCIGALAMSEAMRRAAPSDAVGVASGLLQSTRYLGATVAMVILGQLLSVGADLAAWRGIVVAAIVVAGAHLVVVLFQGIALRRL